MFQHNVTQWHITMLQSKLSNDHLVPIQWHCIQNKTWVLCCCTTVSQEWWSPCASTMTLYTEQDMSAVLLHHCVTGMVITLCQYNDTVYRTRHECCVAAPLCHRNGDPLCQYNDTVYRTRPECCVAAPLCHRNGDPLVPIQWHSTQNKTWVMCCCTTVSQEWWSPCANTMTQYTEQDMSAVLLHHCVTGMVIPLCQYNDTVHRTRHEWCVAAPLCHRNGDPLCQYNDTVHRTRHEWCVAAPLCHRNGDPLVPIQWHSTQNKTWVLCCCTTVSQEWWSLVPIQWHSTHNKTWVLCCCTTVSQEWWSLVPIQWHSTQNKTWVMCCCTTVSQEWWSPCANTMTQYTEQDMSAVLLHHCVTGMVIPLCQYNDTVHRTRPECCVAAPLCHRNGDPLCQYNDTVHRTRPECCVAAPLCHRNGDPLVPIQWHSTQNKTWVLCCCTTVSQEWWSPCANTMTQYTEQDLSAVLLHHCVTGMVIPLCQYNDTVHRTRPECCVAAPLCHRNGDLLVPIQWYSTQNKTWVLCCCTTVSQEWWCPCTNTMIQYTEQDMSAVLLHHCVTGMVIPCANTMTQYTEQDLSDVLLHHCVTGMVIPCANTMTLYTEQDMSAVLLHHCVTGMVIPCANTMTLYTEQDLSAVLLHHCVTGMVIPLCQYNDTVHRTRHECCVAAPLCHRNGDLLVPIQWHCIQNKTWVLCCCTTVSQEWWSPCANTMIQYTEQDMSAVLLHHCVTGMVMSLYQYNDTVHRTRHECCVAAPLCHRNGDPLCQYNDTVHRTRPEWCVAAPLCHRNGDPLCQYNDTVHRTRHECCVAAPLCHRNGDPLVPIQWYSTQNKTWVLCCCTTVSQEWWSPCANTMTLYTEQDLSAVLLHHCVTGMVIPCANTMIQYTEQDMSAVLLHHCVTGMVITLCQYNDTVYRTRHECCVAAPLCHRNGDHLVSIQWHCIQNKTWVLCCCTTVSQEWWSPCVNTMTLYTEQDMSAVLLHHCVTGMVIPCANTMIQYTEQDMSAVLLHHCVTGMVIPCANTMTQYTEQDMSDVLLHHCVTGMVITLCQYNDTVYRTRHECCVAAPLCHRNGDPLCQYNDTVHRTRHECCVAAPLCHRNGDPLCQYNDTVHRTQHEWCVAAPLCHRNGDPLVPIQWYSTQNKTLVLCWCTTVSQEWWSPCVNTMTQYTEQDLSAVLLHHCVTGMVIPLCQYNDTVHRTRHECCVDAPLCHRNGDPLVPIQWHSTQNKTWVLCCCTTVSQEWWSPCANTMTQYTEQDTSAVLLHHCVTGMVITLCQYNDTVHRTRHECCVAAPLCHRNGDPPCQYNDTVHRTRHECCVAAPLCHRNGDHLVPIQWHSTQNTTWVLCCCTTVSQEWWSPCANTMTQYTEHNMSAVLLHHCVTGMVITLCQYNDTVHRTRHECCVAAPLCHRNGDHLVPIQWHCTQNKTWVLCCCTTVSQEWWSPCANTMTQYTEQDMSAVLLHHCVTGMVIPRANTMTQYTEQDTSAVLLHHCVTGMVITLCQYNDTVHRTQHECCVAAPLCHRNGDHLVPIQWHCTQNKTWVLCCCTTVSQEWWSPCANTMTLYTEQDMSAVLLHHCVTGMVIPLCQYNDTVHRTRHECCVAAPLCHRNGDHLVPIQWHCTQNKTWVLCCCTTVSQEWWSPCANTMTLYTEQDMSAVLLHHCVTGMVITLCQYNDTVYRTRHECCVAAPLCHRNGDPLVPIQWHCIQNKTWVLCCCTTVSQEWWSPVPIQWHSTHNQTWVLWCWWSPVPTQWRSTHNQTWVLWCWWSPVPTQWHSTHNQTWVLWCWWSPVPTQWHSTHNKTWVLWCWWSPVPTQWHSTHNQTWVLWCWWSPVPTQWHSTHNKTWVLWCWWSPVPTQWHSTHNQTWVLWCWWSPVPTLTLRVVVESSKDLPHWSHGRLLAHQPYVRAGVVLGHLHTDICYIQCTSPNADVNICHTSQSGPRRMTHDL